MKDTGLSVATINILVEAFSKYPEIDDVILYGSRAKGNYTSRSDIDLVVKGIISRHIISKILLDLDDSDILYSVDLQSYNDLKNQELIDHIDRVGIVLYKK
ncbi:nucleotidyltransferase domain-containing protein [Thiospirochaeta perfilievii]|uniref:Nucleotidyltransferase domain-containing protein n=1 Tax=Thiospirochaeta perfilievii TaxID=252967 RepID=A0A5C1QJI0_9SPIO|nr:nucleotidyltransferase domain-containing protein [Thiospirochaeta perfilievii]QEN06322.1 nucleotidyltransferase domain-containing protein [Thiospirochaeta perfilievii]